MEILQSCPEVSGRLVIITGDIRNAESAHYRAIWAVRRHCLRMVVPGTLCMQNSLPTWSYEELRLHRESM